MYDIEAGKLSTKKYQLYVNIGVNSNLFVLFDDGSDLWMVNEGSQPKLGNSLDDVISLVVERSPEFVVFLFDLQYFLTCLCK